MPTKEQGFQSIQDQLLSYHRYYIFYKEVSRKIKELSNMVALAIMTRSRYISSILLTLIESENSSKDFFYFSNLNEASKEAMDNIRKLGPFFHELESTTTPKTKIVKEKNPCRRIPFYKRIERSYCLKIKMWYFNFLKKRESRLFL